MLNENPNVKKNNIELCSDFKDRMDIDWSEATGDLYIRIFLNWARYSNLAPEIFQFKKKKTGKEIDDYQTKLC